MGGSLVSSGVSVGNGVAVGGSTVGSDVAGSSTTASTANASIAMTPLTGTIAQGVRSCRQTERDPRAKHRIGCRAVHRLHGRIIDDQRKAAERRVLDEDHVQASPVKFSVRVSSGLPLL